MISYIIYVIHIVLVFFKNTHIDKKNFKKKAKSLENSYFCPYLCTIIQLPLITLLD